MATDLADVARSLFEGVMRPLALGGAVKPRHAIGARRALLLRQTEALAAVDAGLLDLVQAARVRRARRFVPVDALPPATDAEWALSAALNDILTAANPGFDAALRRASATRILELAVATLGRVPPPKTAADALSRHTWFARVPGLTRTDTSVTWWTGSRVFRGEPPPTRLTAWPDLRRVNVVATPVGILDLSPLAIGREALADAVGRLLQRSPLTDLATCTREKPPFAWSEITLALVASGPGRTLTLRALERLPAPAVDTALGKATRDLLEQRRADARPALALLSDRALSAVVSHLDRGSNGEVSDGAALARAVGATVALRRLEGGEGGWTDDARARALEGLRARLAGTAGEGAAALLEEPA